MRSRLKTPAVLFYLAVIAICVAANRNTTIADDDGGCTPTNRKAAGCQAAVAKNIAKLYACITSCHIKAQKAAAKGTPFDEEACESGTGKPVSCRAKYDKASAALVTKNACPECLNAGQQGALADRVESDADAVNPLVYCCPPTTTTIPCGGSGGVCAGSCPDGETCSAGCGGVCGCAVPGSSTTCPPTTTTIPCGGQTFGTCPPGETCQATVACECGGGFSSAYVCAAGLVTTTTSCRCTGTCCAPTTSVTSTSSTTTSLP